MTLEEFPRMFSLSLPHGSFWTLWVALLAGVTASAVCPCTLPVGLGVAVACESRSRRAGFTIAASFFVGIVVNLTILGTLAARLGAVLTESFRQYWTLTMALVS